ncbi:MAG: hypothetical protein V3T86_15130 [Planctomycetota bacterium]
MSGSYRLGRLAFCLSGEGPVPTALRRELRSLADVDPGDARLGIEFVECLPQLRESVPAGLGHAAENAFRWKHETFAYQLGKDGRGLRLLVQPKPEVLGNQDGPERLRRFRDWDFLLPEEAVARDLLYGLFDYASQVAQVPLGQSHLCASAVERDGRAIALVAESGVGKTAMLHLVLGNGWRYLSDDLLVVDRDGVAHRSPKRLQIYGSNVKDQPHLGRALMRGRTLADRLQWAYRMRKHGPRKVRRRVSAKRLFGKLTCASSARLGAVFDLVRDSRQDRIVLFETNPTELARPAAKVVLEKIAPYAEISEALRGVRCCGFLPTADELERQTESVLSRAFEHADRCFRVRIPHGATAAQLHAFLDAKLPSLLGERARSQP